MFKSAILHPYLASEATPLFQLEQIKHAVQKSGFEA